MRWKIRHQTHYRYSAPLQYLIQHLRLTPMNSDHQKVISWTVSGPSPLAAGIDTFGNQQHTLSLTRPTSLVTLLAHGEVVTQHLNDGRLPVTLNAMPVLLFTVPTTYTEVDAQVTDFAQSAFARAWQQQDWLAMADEVRQAVRYQSGVTHVTSTASHALALGQGVCQDHAHVFIAACRVHRIPCRYVSGYFYPGERDEQASHAWVDIWTETGWRSLDVTHGQFAAQRHVRLAIGRDYETAAPVRGVRMGGGEEMMTVEVSITPMA